MTSVTSVIPARDAEATLGAALGCLADQTFTDRDAIVVDDGSRDRTGAVAAEWRARDRRIQLLTNRDPLGASAARNVGARRAQGDWLHFLDSDDRVAPDFLERMLAAAASDPPPEIVACGFARMTPDGRSWPAEAPPDADIFAHLSRGNPFATHALLVRRETFLASGGFDRSLEAGEDWDLWQRMARGGCRFARVERCLATYGLRPDSLSHDAVRVLRTARRLILQGHGRDPRVRSPAPELADGSPALQAAGTLVYNSFWCAGVAVGTDQDIEKFLGEVRLLPVSRIDPAGAATALRRGVAFGACALPSDWPRLLQLNRSAIIEVLRGLADLLATAGLAADAVQRIEQDVLSPETRGNGLGGNNTQTAASTGGDC